MTNSLSSSPEPGEVSLTLRGHSVNLDGTVLLQGLGSALLSNLAEECETHRAWDPQVHLNSEVWISS